MSYKGSRKRIGFIVVVRLRQCPFLEEILPEYCFSTCLPASFKPDRTPLAVATKKGDQLHLVPHYVKLKNGIIRFL